MSIDLAKKYSIPEINQVVSMIYDPGSDVTTSSTSFQDSGMTLQITPSNTNSKILLFFAFSYAYTQARLSEIFGP